MFVYVNLFHNTGTSDYVLGSPIFKHVVIDRSGKGATEPESLLHILSLGTNETQVKVRHTYLHGEKVKDPTISDYQLNAGGILQFVMEDEVFTTPIK